MKTFKNGIIWAWVFAAGIVLAEDSSGPWNEWLASQATPKTRQVTTLSADGTVLSVVITTEYNMHVKQVNIEERTLDENNQLSLSRQRRSTEVLDAHGGKYLLREEKTGLTDTLVPRHITEEVKTSTRTVTTVRARDDKDRLVVTQRTISERQEDGSLVTTVESRNADGNLGVTQRQIEW